MQLLAEKKTGRGADANWNTGEIHFWVAGPNGGGASSYMTSTPAMMISAERKVGIGTATPNKALTVYGGNDNGIWIDSQGAQYTSLAFGHNGSEKANIAWDNTNGYTNITTYSNGHLAMSTGGSINAFLNSSGNFGIGTTAPSYKLDVSGGQVAIRNSAGPQLLFFEPGRAYADGMRLLRYQDKLSLTYGWNAGEEALTVVGGTGSDVGYVGIGTTSPSYKLEVNGTANIVSHLRAHCLGVGTTTPNALGVIRAAGDIIAYYSSDKRLKDNITKIEKPLEKIDKINGYEFDWNDKQELYEGHDVGVVAQEVEDVYPQIVETRQDGYKAVKYEKLVPLLIESIKELKAEIQELKNNK